MIKMLMTRIREFVTRGVTALPLKENLIPRLKYGKGGGVGMGYLDGRKSG
jgi:hypothetical protein